MASIISYFLLTEARNPVGGQKAVGDLRGPISLILFKKRVLFLLVLLLSDFHR